MRLNTYTGFSIVELLIMTGIIVGLGIGISQLSVDLGKFQKNTFTMSEVNEFSGAIGYYLNQNCKAELQGKEFPFTGPKNLILSQYGSWGNVPIPTIEKGTKFEEKYKVTELTWEHKSSIPIRKYKRAGETLNVAVARIVLKMEIMKDTKPLALNPYVVEIPLIVEDGTNLIKDCLSGSLGPTGQDICTTMGAEHDPDVDSCIPKDHCFIVTSFINCTSNKGWSPTHSSSSPCEELILPHISLNGKKQYFHFYHNDEGGELGTCPNGTSTIFTGNIIKMGQVSCGSGCSNTYVSEGKVYLCVKCDPSHL